NTPLFRQKRVQKYNHFHFYQNFFSLFSISPHQITVHHLFIYQNIFQKFFFTPHTGPKTTCVMARKIQKNIGS
ncbi:MAG: hypothetical protein J6X58_00890, partial [Bacteroidales bacterium]|nr:hypothetical protein [Bacteroidales bacterium]